MKTAEITFPVTLEAFIAYQEAGIGRDIGSNEREAVAAFVPVINGCYKFGTMGDSDAIKERLNRLEDCLVHEAEGAVQTHFLKSMRWWMCYAYERGRTEVMKGATE